ncbi:MAG: hypothetical protein QOH62_2834, partial [Solirubrobacteraceae bacterium]|nr:hypothetical protein [Solirubrobacteraceae bacterium]
MPTRSSLLALLACLLVVPAAASAAPGDLEPYPFADGIEAGGEVNTTQVIGDRVFLGGSFGFAGPLTGHLAFAGTADGAIGASPRFDNVVRAAVADGAGGWFLGGAFTHIDGTAVSGLAHLKADGTVDQGFPQTAGGEPLALLLDAGKLYVGGSFTTLGGLARRGLARIDTATGAVEAWDPGCETVLAMALAGDALYVGSTTQGAQLCGGSAHDYAHKISTSTGAADASFDPAPDSMVRAVAVSGGAVYLGGSFTATPRPRMAKVDAASGALDASFHPQFPNSYGVFAIVPDGPGQLLVGGDFGAVDGVTGTANLARISTGGAVDTTFKPAVRGGNVQAIVRDGNGHLYVGGNFSQNNVGGDSPIIGGAYRDHVARLDAITGQADDWRADANGTVGAIALAGDRVLLGGFQDITGGAIRRGLAAFDRVSGKLLDTDAQLDGTVEQLAQAGGALYALGSFSHSGVLARHGLVKLAPATGAADPSWDPGDGQGNARTLAATPDALYVGGYFEGTDTIGGSSPDYVARLALEGSGAADSSFDAQLDGPVDYLAVGGGAVYAAGSFTHAGGAPRAGLAKLAAADGAVGTPLAAGANDDIDTIGFHDGKLYVGGSFSSFAGQPRAYLARIDAASGALDDWNPGANGEVRSIAFAPGTIFVGTSPDVWPGPALAALSTETGAAAAGFAGDTV